MLDALRARLATSDPEGAADIEPSEATILMSAARLAGRSPDALNEGETGPGLPSDLGTPAGFESRDWRDPMDPPTVPPHPDEEFATVQMSRDEVFASAVDLVANVEFEDTDPEEPSTVGTAVPTGSPRATGASEVSSVSVPDAGPNQTNWIADDAAPPSVGDEPAIGSFSAFVSDEVEEDDRERPADAPLVLSGQEELFPIRQVAPWLVAAMLVMLAVWLVVRLIG
jgi:hypothetical protein